MSKGLSAAEVEGILMRLLEDTMSTNLGLSSNDADYHLEYIAQKVSLNCANMERLSDISLKLTQLGIEITRMAVGKKALAAMKRKEFKASPEYAAADRNAKADWLENQLAVIQEEERTWITLQHVVSQIKEAVAERSGTFKRLDSDLRLHAKLLEARIAAGATGWGAYTGANRSSTDVNTPMTSAAVADVDIE